MGTEYYRIDVRRLRVRECWRIAPDPVTFVFVLGARVRLTTAQVNEAFPIVSEWPAIDAADRPEGVVRRTEPVIRALTAAGFRVLVHGRFPVLEGHWAKHSTLLLSRDRQTGASVIDLRAPVGTETITNLTTRFTDGTFGITGNGKPMIDVPPSWVWAYGTGLPADELYERHRENIGTWEAGGKLVSPYADHEGSLVAVQLEHEFRDYQLDRGVFVRMTDDEVEAHELAHG